MMNRTRYLADTQIILWSFNEPHRLSDDVRAILCDDDSTVYFSLVSIWEIAIKYGTGKLDLQGLDPKGFYEKVWDSYYECARPRNEVVASSFQLPRRHKDPFDRMLFWEAIQNHLILLSADKASDLYVEDGLQVIH